MKFYEYLIKVLRRYKSTTHLPRTWSSVYSTSKNKKSIRKLEYPESLAPFKRHAMADTQIVKHVHFFTPKCFAYLKNIEPSNICSTDKS